MSHCPLAKYHQPKKTEAPTLEVITRRNWVKQFSFGTAASFIGGKLWTGRVLADVFPGSDFGVIKIKISEYPALENVYGSVQFKFTNALGAYYPFTVTRAPGDIFHAVGTFCDHQQGVASPYDENTGVMTCTNNHGSTWNIQGQLVTGPATTNLPCYESDYNATAGTVTVSIPGIGTKVNTVSRVTSTASPFRLRLQFPSLDNNFIYRVQYQQSLTDAPVFVNFATGLNTPPALTQVGGNSGTRTVYVDATGTSGFYAIALIVTPYP